MPAPSAASPASPDTIAGTWPPACPMAAFAPRVLPASAADAAVFACAARHPRRGDGLAPRLPIDAHQVDVWLTRYDQLADPHLLERLGGLLSDEERQQEARFHFADDGLRYRVTRAMVRTVLSRYAGLAPADWLFTANAYGRPEIAARVGQQHRDAADLCFNLSHTRGLIALAVSRRRALGIDVENLSVRQFSLGIAQHFFAPREAADLARQAPALQQDRFFEYWTFKESYVKARGMGFSIPLDQFSFDYPGPWAVRMCTDPVLGDPAERWSFWQFRPTPHHMLAICAERVGRGASLVTMRHLVPTVADEVVALPLLRRSGAPIVAHAGPTCRS